MPCQYWGGAIEWASDKACCSRCLNLFQHDGAQLTPVVVEAPGGGWNPELNQIFGKSKKSGNGKVTTN